MERSANQVATYAARTTRSCDGEREREVMGRASGSSISLIYGDSPKLGRLIFANQLSFALQHRLS